MGKKQKARVKRGVNKEKRSGLRRRGTLGRTGKGLRKKPSVGRQ